MSGLDLSVLEALYALRELPIVFFFIGVTELGSTVTIGGTALSLGLYLLVRRRLSQFAGLCVSVIGTIIVVFPLKEIVARARPDTFYRAFAESGFSFPSGHAAFSMALYGFLAYLAWKYIPSETWRYITLSAAIIIIGLIGFSRLYLGLHYFSDVLGGYAIGAIFLALGIWTSERLQQNKTWF